MINRIIEFSIYNKLIIGLMVLGLIGWGLFSFTQIPIDAVPDITDNQIQVITTSPSLAAQEVEQFITFPLEMNLGNIPRVQNIRSISRFGLSVITVVFDEDMDIYLARQLISERIDAAKAQIPPGFGNPEMGPITTGLGEIYQYVIYPEKGYEEKYSPMDLRSIQDWVVKRQLIGIKGVIEINSSGGYLKQYEIAVNPDRLKSMNLSLQEVFKAVSENNANTGGSYIEKEESTYFIRGEGFLKNMQDIGEVVVASRNGFPILVKDIAKIQLGHAPRFGAVTMNGIGEVVAGQVLMLKGENPAAVTQRVKERMVQIQKSLPEGILIEPYLDRTKLVNQTTRTVATNLIEGGLIVIFVLVLMLGNLRAGLIAASVIPLSMLFAVSMMRVFGVSANLMSLGAIDFGLIVDGAVIIVEAILHHLGLKHRTEKISQATMNQEVMKAASRIRKSAAFGEIIILIVYLPILFLVGIEGKMFRPMAQTVSFAILGALILSLTYVPMMSALFLSKSPLKPSRISQKIMEFCQRLYAPVLEVALRVKVLFVALTVLLFGLSLWTLNNMGGEFIPTLEEGDFALHQILPPGSSIAQGVKVSAELQNILLDKFPEVEKVVTKIGTAEIPTDIMPLEAGDIYVILKPKSDWTSASSREELFEKMEEEMNQFPGVIYEFTQPIQMRFNELMTGVRQDIAIKIYGEDLGLLAQKGNEAKELIEQLPGVGDIQVEPTAGLQQMLIQYDRQKIAKYGLSIEAINRIIRGSFAGEKSGVLFEGEKRFDIVVRLDKPFRQEIRNLRDLYIPLNNGSQIPLSELAQVSFEEGPTQISRDNTQRRITIGVNARGTDVTTLVNMISNKLESSLDLPSGYYLSYGGQFENLEKAMARLKIAIPVALLLIFFLLYSSFKSVEQALLIFTAIPMSAIGGIWALSLRGMPFSISAGVGFIALFGVAVLNGIVLVAYFNTLKQEGMDDILDRIREGTRVRLRPVLMTGAVASLGFMPMAISQAAGAEVQQPLATVVIGGLISATFLTLIILPILYFYSEKRIKLLGNKSAMVFLLLCIGFGSGLNAQNSTLNLEQALEIASQNAPALKRDMLKQEQQEALTSGTLLTPRMNVFTNGEEVNQDFSGGIRSVGFLQNFYLPGAGNASKAFQTEKAARASSQTQISRQALYREVRKSYYNWVYSRELLNSYQEWTSLYQEFGRIAKLRFEAGETGKMGVLSTQTREKEIQLGISQAQYQQEIAAQAFHNSLFTDTSYQIALDKLPEPSNQLSAQSTEHPIIHYYKQNVNMATATVKVQKSRLLPQIQVGAQWQSINGVNPFWGYQLGINIPLFRGVYRSNIESAELGVKATEAALDYQERLLKNKQTILSQELQKAYEALRYLKEELLVLAENQQELSREAYQQGEINYLQYLQSLDQSVQLRLRYLNSLKQWHQMHADWLYWTAS